MGVYIEGIEMPKERDSFTLTIKYNGLVFDTETGIQVVEARELPPHGRLIDADELERDAHKRLLVCQANNDQFQKPYEVMRAIALAPTIIKAEENE